jgi:hypothetical protein
VSIQRKPEIQAISTLGLRGQYRQVKEYATLKRALNPHYATPPEMQGTRWHIWFDGKEVVSMVCAGHGKKSRWAEGPSIAVSDFSTGDGIMAGLGSLLSSHKGGVGVIIHVADCSVLNSVKEMYDSVEKMAVVRVLSVENPSSVILGDVHGASEGHRWRPMLVSGAKKGKFALFRLSSRDLTAGQKLAQLDGPFSVAVRAAGMEAIVVGQAIAGVLDAESAPAGEFGRILVYYYRRSTLIGVYSPQGVLTELRLLPQSEGGVPQTLRNDFSLILQKAPSPEMLVTVFQCAEGVEVLAEELGSVKSVSGVNVSLQILERQVLPEFCKSAGLPLLLGDNPLPLEFGVEYPEWLTSHAIGGKVEELQMLDLAKADFAQDSAEGVASVPSPRDLKLFILGRLSRGVLAILTVGLLGLLGWQSFSNLRSEEWSVDMDKVAEISDKIMRLRAEAQKTEKIKKLLIPQADINFAMEVFLALFPDANETEIKTFQFDYKQPVGEEVGRILDMTFSGEATRRGLALLNRLRGEDYLTSLVSGVAAAQDLPVVQYIRSNPPRFSFAERAANLRDDVTEDEDTFAFEFNGNFQMIFPPKNYDPEE